MKKTLYIALAIVALALTGCEGDSSCRQDLRVRAVISVVRDSLVQVQVVDTVKHDTTLVWQHQNFTSTPGMQIQGVGVDSLIANGTVTKFLLPIRKDRDTTAFVMRYQGVSDTLKLVYERNQQFVSLACGCSVFATLQEMLGQGRLVDSVYVHNSSVTNVQEQNLTLFISSK